MRVRRCEDDTLRFSKEISTGSAETLTLRIARKFETLASVCENRMQAMFPVDGVKEVIAMCEELRNITPKCNIPEEYIEYIRTHKEAVGYFREALERREDAERRIVGKRRTFEKFRKALINELSRGVERSE